MASISIIAVLFQLLTLAFWIFVVYVGVTLVKNSNESKKTLENMELELRKIHHRFEKNTNRE